MKSLGVKNSYFIDTQAGGGFAARNVGDHAFGGPAAFPFTGNKNSDIQDGKIKPDAPKAQLYNLKRDPRQSNNVIQEFPEVAKKMKEEMERMKLTSLTSAFISN